MAAGLTNRCKFYEIDELEGFQETDLVQFKKR
jgi:hypothetical protein